MAIMFGSLALRFLKGRDFLVIRNVFWEEFSKSLSQLPKSSQEAIEKLLNERAQTELGELISNYTDARIGARFYLAFNVLGMVEYGVLVNAKALHEAARAPPMGYRDNLKHRALPHARLADFYTVMVVYFCSGEWCVFILALTDARKTRIAISPRLAASTFLRFFFIITPREIKKSREYHSSKRPPSGDQGPQNIMFHLDLSSQKRRRS